ncbi:cytosine-specific methyltransferase [Streptomyces gelaticus]|uniref:Cytosine-specific methyltransferase n=1 Tax=Streptomyces gelaticus TaxID=285446 RepID=A0ABQ2W1M0_9ACTN|nr:DNA cytosine methyltransferase [Streptomyces gelaticus]GGV85103.1 cytosine-specific methyltransferase [Streptomyces gelaticus]
MTDRNALTSVEICAGAGGQAIGLEQAGFQHLALVEYNSDACRTLRHNRPEWNVIEKDIREFDPVRELASTDTDLLAGGIPCTPYSVAGNQLGSDDPRDLLPEAIRLVEALHPKAVMLENVSSLAKGSKFAYTRKALTERLAELGYAVQMQILDAQDFGVPQRRKRALIVALREDIIQTFQWPIRLWELPPTVGETLEESMASNGWSGASEWARLANGIAPTLVGGSTKHGGGDLGPDRAKQAWSRLAVNGDALELAPPGPEFRLRHGVGRGGWKGYPKLTAAQAAMLQGFPPDWHFTGSKTARYKQIGNAFPPPVARAVAASIMSTLLGPHTDKST